jgi:4'-phosphopantetheinyl transferase
MDRPTIESGTIHLWKVDTSDQSIPDKCLPVLSDYEKERAALFKFDDARRRYVISQGVLRMILSNYLAVDPLAVQIGRQPKGKPFSIDDEFLFFNTSNSSDLCVYSFNSDGEIGVDIEHIRKLPDLDELIKRNFTAQEIDFINRKPDDRASRFFRFWTIKEAYLKAIGEGMRLTPDNLEFQVERNVVTLLSVKGVFEFDDWNFLEFEPEKGYVGTLVYKLAGAKAINFDYHIMNF